MSFCRGHRKILLERSGLTLQEFPRFGELGLAVPATSEPLALNCPYDDDSVVAWYASRTARGYAEAAIARKSCTDT
jgi:hypothetical protein